MEGLTPAQLSMSWVTSRGKVSQTPESIEELEVWSHGLFSANLNVVYKPECSIRKEVREQVLYLSCLVKAFPPNVTYYWYQGEHLISCKSLLTSHIFSSLTLF